MFLIGGIDVDIKIGSLLDLLCFRLTFKVLITLNVKFSKKLEIKKFNKSTYAYSHTHKTWVL